MNIQYISTLLRESYFKDDVVNNCSSYTKLIQTLCKNIPCARSEELMLHLAKAYHCYQFDLPAFLDFHGQIYRSDVLHFHDRDLAISLIVFADIAAKQSAVRKISAKMLIVLLHFITSLSTPTKRLIIG